MKIRMIPENKVYVGTPTDIVKKLSDNAIFLGRHTPDEYLKAVLQRMPSLKIKGPKTYEGQCEALIRGMLENGMAKLVIEEAYVDQYQIRILREALNMNQTKFAGKIKVSFATVNRWEKGLHIPRTAAILQNLRRAAGSLYQSMAA